MNLQKLKQQLQTKYKGVTMNIRDNKKYKLKKEVEDYEHNLKLFLSSKQSELETLLRVSMPHQLTSMKTILWLNFLLIGFSFHLMNETTFSVYYIPFFTISFISICFVIIALLKRRYKHYGVIGDIDYMSKDIVNNEWSKSAATMAILTHADIAVIENKEIMKSLSRYMHCSLWSTLLAIFFFVIAVGGQIYTKGDHNIMAEKPTSDTVVTKPSVSIAESSERSLNTPPSPPPPKPDTKEK